MTDLAPSPFAPARQPGKVGPHRESHEPRLMASKFMGGQATQFIAFDATNGIGADAWNVDHNDRYSNCGEAGMDHANMAKAGDVSLLGKLAADAIAAGKLEAFPDYPDLDSGLVAYCRYELEQNPGQPNAEGLPSPDNGVDNASWLAFLYQHGVIDLYFEVPLEEMDRYGSLCGGLLVGWQLSDDCQQEFADNVAWGQPGDVPDPNEGHDTYFVIADGKGNGQVVTWGRTQGFTAEARTNGLITDAWGFLDEEDAKRKGFDVDSLKAALADVNVTGTITPGTDAPTAVTPPVPAPAPAPAPVVPEPQPSELESFADMIRRFVKRAEEELEKALDLAGNDTEAGVHIDVAMTYHDLAHTLAEASASRSIQ